MSRRTPFTSRTSTARPGVRGGRADAGELRLPATLRTSSPNADEAHALEALFVAIGHTFRPAARRDAERAARKSVEYCLRKLDHETTKVVVPIQISLGRLRTLADEREIDRAAILREIAVVAERVDYLQAILDRAGAPKKAAKLREESVRAIVEEARGHLVDRLGERAGRLAMTVAIAPGLKARVDRAALLQANVVPAGVTSPYWLALVGHGAPAVSARFCGGWHFLLRTRRIHATAWLARSMG